VFNGNDIVQLKILSDRRAEGGGIAWLAKFLPPPGKLIKIVMALGLRFAPAYDAGALNPGCMPLFVAFIAAIVLQRSPQGHKSLPYLSFCLALSLLSAGTTPHGASRAPWVICYSWSPHF
jgi:hypothetical protein